MYAPPAYPPAGPAYPAGPVGPLTREQARAKLIFPGIALACVSGLLILVFILDLVLFATGMPIGATSGVPPEMQEWIRRCVNAHAHLMRGRVERGRLDD